MKLKKQVESTWQAPDPHLMKGHFHGGWPNPTGPGMNPPSLIAVINYPVIVGTVPWPSQRKRLPHGGRPVREDGVSVCACARAGGCACAP